MGRSCWKGVDGVDGQTEVGDFVLECWVRSFLDCMELALWLRWESWTFSVHADWNWEFLVVGIRIPLRLMASRG